MLLKGLMSFFWMMYSIEYVIVICGEFPATTNKVVCIVRRIEGHAWDSPTHCWDKKNGEDYIYWMVLAMRAYCITAHYLNDVKESDTQPTKCFLATHICLRFFDIAISCILLLLPICMFKLFAETYLATSPVYIKYISFLLILRNIFCN